MICVLVGPPGSGKGTQAELIAADLGVPHISTGELLRAEAAAGTPLGREVAPVLAAGELVPDELMERLLQQRLAAPDAAPGAILDGYPRTVPQAEALDRCLTATGRRPDVVMLLEVEEEILVRRLLDRAAKEHRTDDNPDSIAERLAEYRQLTEPVIDHYRGEGVPVLAVDGTGPVDAVHARVARAMRRAGLLADDQP
ncbi:MAG TPA: adenylate kinase [Candidatus Dormibacteraeota bacterium]|nr:adenylate kinase [Candidatus Dormibacteraeota bacterium]